MDGALWIGVAGMGLQLVLLLFLIGVWRGRYESKDTEQQKDLAELQRLSRKLFYRFHYLSQYCDALRVTLAVLIVKTNTKVDVPDPPPFRDVE